MPPPLSPDATESPAGSASGQTEDQKAPSKRAAHRKISGLRIFAIIRRVISGTMDDGFILAGNFAYMALLTLFPFFILIAATVSLVGETHLSGASLDTTLRALPAIVAQVIDPVAHDVMTARSGWVLWMSGIIALWTVSGLMETIREILRRAYDAVPVLTFWRYRLASTAVVISAVVVLLVSLFAQIAISTAQEIILSWFPQAGWIIWLLTASRLIPALLLFFAVEAIFITLTPVAYRSRAFPKWPGAVLVTIWWVSVAAALPTVLRLFFNYNATYGSLAGVMIVLFFFWLVGLGIVIGAKLNAVLALGPGANGNNSREEPGNGNTNALISGGR